MSAVRVSVHVAEAVELDDHLHVGESGDPTGWLYLGERGDVALWGSPPGLRRLAAGLVLIAERAESLPLLRHAVIGNGAGVEGRAGETGVIGS